MLTLEDTIGDTLMHFAANFTNICEAVRAALHFSSFFPL